MGGCVGSTPVQFRVITQKGGVAVGRSGFATGKDNTVECLEAELCLYRLTVRIMIEGTGLAPFKAFTGLVKGLSWPNKRAGDQQAISLHPFLSTRSPQRRSSMHIDSSHCASLNDHRHTHSESHYSMAKHRSQAQFERAKWTLLILAPGWVLQSTITTTLMGMFAWNFGITLREHNEKNSKSSMPTLELT